MPCHQSGAPFFFIYKMRKTNGPREFFQWYIHLSLHFYKCQNSKKKKEVLKWPSYHTHPTNAFDLLSPLCQAAPSSPAATAADSIPPTAVTLPWMNSDAECTDQGQELGQDHTSSLLRPCGCAVLFTEKASWLSWEECQRFHPPHWEYTGILE